VIQREPVVREGGELECKGLGAHDLDRCLWTHIQMVTNNSKLHQSNAPLSLLILLYFAEGVGGTCAQKIRGLEMEKGGWVGGGGKRGPSSYYALSENFTN